MEAFNSISIYNGDVTVTGTGGSAFVTGFGKVVFNGNFHWMAAAGEYGLNGQAPDVTFTSLSSNNPSQADGLNILNLHGDATVRNGQNNTFGQATNIWAPPAPTRTVWTGLVSRWNSWEPTPGQIW